MNKKGSFLGDLAIFLIGFLVGTLFGTYIITLIEKFWDFKMPLI